MMGFQGGGLKPTLHIFMLKEDLMANYRRLFIENHRYFITIITFQRNPILIDNIKLLRESFIQSKKRYVYDINAIVILPEHLHMIITPKISTEYPMIISSIKSYFSKNCPSKYYQHLEQSLSRENKRYKPIWQKRYYEHTIRDENDMLHHINYIENNPIKHQLVKNKIDWEYSSYYKNNQ